VVSFYRKMVLTVSFNVALFCRYRMMKPIIESYEFAKSGLSDGSKKLSEHIYIEWSVVRCWLSELALNISSNLLICCRYLWLVQKILNSLNVG